MPHGDEPVARARPARRCASSARPASPGTPSRTAGCPRSAEEARCPIINISGGTEVGACFLSPLPVDAAQAVLARRARRWAWRWTSSTPTASRSRRARSASWSARKPWPGDDRAASGAIPSATSRPTGRAGRRLGARRLGLDRRRRLLVPARPLDDTLNIAGKRIGPAEVESALVGHPAVAEACAIGVPHDVKGEVVWCFCVLQPGDEPTRRARPRRARDACRRELGKAFAPARGPLRRRRCPRRAAPRSCAAPCAPPRWARIPATSPRWRIRRWSSGCRRPASGSDRAQRYSPIG